MTNIHPTIVIDMGKKCVECGKGGAVASGLCLKCTSKAISGKVMRSETGKAVQRRWLADKAARWK